MAMPRFTWTKRAAPILQIGIGDTRIDQYAGRWDVARWDQAGAIWSGIEPAWQDVSCDAFSFRAEYGRQRTTDRFVPGQASVVVWNATGWADPFPVDDPGRLTMRPGRAIRVGVQHAVFGMRWLFRGFIDAMTPVYDPTQPDTVELSCIDALGEVNRAKVLPVDPPIGGGDTVDERVGRLLDLALWPGDKRALQPVSDTLIEHDLGGQLADLLGQAADSGGGNVYGDLDGSVVYKGRDWQMFTPGTPNDGTIGNVGTSDVCPVQWERPFARADLATRVIIGRDTETAQVLDDPEGQLLYGVEPFERTDLLTQRDDEITALGERILRVRSALAAPRIRSVTLDARTGDDALDLMTTVDIYKPSRYRCRLELDRGMVFDAEHFATGVAHELTASSWSVRMNLDLAGPYAAIGGRWDGAYWDQALWSGAA